MIDREHVKRKLHDYFSDKKAVVAVYLFGSVARGTQLSSSDIDVAILFCDSLTSLERFEARMTIASELQDILEAEVDVVDLQSVDSQFVHRVLLDKVLVLCRDTARRVEFEVASRRTYFDRQRYREEYSRQAIARLREMARDG